MVYQVPAPVHDGRPSDNHQADTLDEGLPARWGVCAEEKRPPFSEWIKEVLGTILIDDDTEGWSCTVPSKTSQELANVTRRFLGPLIAAGKKQKKPT